MEHQWGYRTYCEQCGVRREDFEDGLSPKCKIKDVASIRFWGGVKRVADALTVACIGHIAKTHGYDVAETRRIVDREVKAIFDSLSGHLDYQYTEAGILNERLARRYDFSMAINEAANRAIAAKKAAGQPNPHNLSNFQEASLKAQKETLQRALKNA